MSYSLNFKNILLKINLLRYLQVLGNIISKQYVFSQEISQCISQFWIKMYLIKN